MYNNRWSLSVRADTKRRFIFYKENKAYVELKRAPKKPILKPFQEEQQSPMGHFCVTTRHQKIKNLFNFFSSNLRYEGGEVFAKSFSECCSSRQTWWKRNVTAVLFTICTFSWNTDKRFCRQRKNKTTTKRTRKHPETDQTDVQIMSPTGEEGFHRTKGAYSRSAGLGRGGQMMSRI